MEIIGIYNNIETTIFKGTLENMEDKIAEENIGRMGIMIEAEIDEEKGHSQGIMVTIGIKVPLTVDQGQDLELALIEIG